MNGALNFIISGLSFGMCLVEYLQDYFLIFLFLGIINFIGGIFLEFMEIEER